MIIIFTDIVYLIKMTRMLYIKFCCLLSVDKSLVTVAKVAEKGGFSCSWPPAEIIKLEALPIYIYLLQY